ncbi:hypothetical protein NP233_g10909 [Leucocoprinus birnbaumii]|uniref:Uncharacterized protein n=1 Tax=Leucocoprinus birnbaumii TaxID=56174 RepID=A0AAD5VJG8_9AGAR|nr:hypothetical protein NP233_g10909 [Leucocoprinus birnbaumii]
MEVECEYHKLGIGIIMVELFGVQGPSLPPSNAVYEYALPGDPEHPEDYYKAKCGHSTFLFRIPLSPSSPASINFANGPARLVTDKDESRKAEEGENGQFWMPGHLIGGLLVTEESACVELQVKNHSSQKIQYGTNARTSPTICTPLYTRHINLEASFANIRYDFDCTF